MEETDEKPEGGAEGAAAESGAEGEEAAAELRAEEESAKAMEAEVPHPSGYPESGQEPPS
jgi:hypothetical protein